MTDKYLEGHPLERHMDIKSKWTTPIAELHLNLPEDIRLELIKFVASVGYGTTMGTHDEVGTQKFEQGQYNLFNEAKRNPIVAEFEGICSEMMRYYIAKAYNISDAENLDIEARAFGSMHTKGRRTYPHYHHAFDFVMIHYLTVGGEFDLVNQGQDSQELVVVPPNSEVKRLWNESSNAAVKQPVVMGKGEGSHKLSDDKLPCEGSGTFILIDPRPAINYPYNQKALSFTPEKGKTIFHPAYMWHESNAFTDDGIRCAVVVNARVLTQNNSAIITRLPKK